MEPHTFIFFIVENLSIARFPSFNMQDPSYIKMQFPVNTLR